MNDDSWHTQRSPEIPDTIDPKLLYDPMWGNAGPAEVGDGALPSSSESVSLEEDLKSGISLDFAGNAELEPYKRRVSILSDRLCKTADTWAQLGGQLGVRTTPENPTDQRLSLLLRSFRSVGADTRPTRSDFAGALEFCLGGLNEVQKDFVNYRAANRLDFKEERHKTLHDLSLDVDELQSLFRSLLKSVNDRNVTEREMSSTQYEGYLRVIELPAPKAKNVEDLYVVGTEGIDSPDEVTRWETLGRCFAPRILCAFCRRNRENTSSLVCISRSCRRMGTSKPCVYLPTKYSYV